MIAKKYAKLRDIIKEKGSVLVSFSGGVDSSLVAKVACDVLGKKAAAVTVDSDLFTRAELADAKKLAKKIGIRHYVVRAQPLKNRDIVHNTAFRCYYCKKDMMKLLKKTAKEKKYAFVLDGTNADDLKKYRPGLRALWEHNIESPLVDAGITKEDSRKIAKKLKLPSADKESNTCLATRIPLREPITKPRLKKIEAAEDYLKKLKIKSLRVRDRGDLARIETDPAGVKIVLKNAERIKKRLKAIGYEKVDLSI